MKKSLFLLLAVVLIAPSCKKEAPTIEGKWHLYKTAAVSAGERRENDENSYYEFAGGTVKITDKNGYVDDFSYSFDQEHNKLSIGNLEYSVEKFTAKEMVWLFTGTIMTVIDGELVRIDEEYYDYFRKE
jgi:hypothetical protein